MEISKELKDKFKYYANVNIHDLDDFPEFNLIHDLIVQTQRELEEAYFNFLNNNGYKIEKPYTIEQVEKIKEDLAKDDKFLDYIEYTEFSDNCTQAYHYILPFFNCISHPYTQKEKENLLESFKEFNRKEKNNE